MVSATLGASAPQATIPDVTQQTNRDSVRNFREVILATPLRRCKIHFRCQKFLETGSIHALILGEGENRVTSSFCLSLDGTSLDPGLKRDQNGIGTATSCRLLTECVPKSFSERLRESHTSEKSHTSVPRGVPPPDLEKPCITDGSSEELLVGLLVFSRSIDHDEDVISFVVLIPFPAGEQRQLDLIGLDDFFHELFVVFRIVTIFGLE